MGQYGLFILIVAAIGMVLYVFFFRRRKKPDNTAQIAYIEGLKSIIAGDLQTAFVKLRQTVELDTENADAYLKMGDLFREKKMIDKALQIHRELTLRRGVPVDLKSEIHKSLALDYIEAGETDKAIELLQPMIKNEDLKGWAEEKLLELYLAGKMWDQAENLYHSIARRKKIKEGTALTNIKIMVGRILYDKGDFHKARLAFKEALSYDRKNPFAYMYIAESYKQENRIDDAVEYLKKFCEEVPRFAFLAFPAIEETFFDLGRFGEVEDIYRGVLNEDPENLPAKIALAGILEKKGEIQTAENLLRSVLDSGSSNPAAAIRLAKILAGDGRSEEGFEILSDLADKVKYGSDVFKCKNCGESLKRPEPYCPKCNTLGAFL